MVPAKYPAKYNVFVTIQTAEGGTITATASGLEKQQLIDWCAQAGPQVIGSPLFQQLAYYTDFRLSLVVSNEFLGQVFEREPVQGRTQAAFIRACRDASPGILEALERLPTDIRL